MPPQHVWWLGWTKGPDGPGAAEAAGWRGEGGTNYSHEETPILGAANEWGRGRGWEANAGLSGDIERKEGVPAVPSWRGIPGRCRHTAYFFLVMWRAGCWRGDAAAVDRKSVV